MTTRVGSAPEVVADGVTGFVTEPTVCALAEATAALLDDGGLRHRFGEAARVRAEREFSGPRLVADTTRIYKELAGNGARPCGPGSWRSSASPRSRRSRSSCRSAVASRSPAASPTIPGPARRTSPTPYLGGVAIACGAHAALSCPAGRPKLR